MRKSQIQRKKNHVYFKVIKDCCGFCFWFRPACFVVNTCSHNARNWSKTYAKAQVKNSIFVYTFRKKNFCQNSSYSLNWAYSPQFLYLHGLGLLTIFFLLHGLHLLILYFIRLNFVCQKLIFFHKIAEIIVLIMELCEYLKFWNLSKLDIKLSNFSCLRSKWPKCH